MTDFVKKWLRKHFSHEEAIILLFLSLAAALVIWWLGSILAPVFAAMLFAYLLAPLVDRLDRVMPYWAALSAIFILFLGGFFLVLLLMLPVVWSQVVSLVSDIPKMLNYLQDSLLAFADTYPETWPEIDFEALVVHLNIDELAMRSRPLVTFILNYSLSSLNTLFLLMIYSIVVPLMVFFLLKDRRLFWQKVQDALPRQRAALNRIAKEVDQQVSNYVRGKAIEMMIVALVSYLVFSFFGLNYAALLAVLVGFSVLIPYVGAALVTIPVTLVALFQFGLGAQFYSIVVSYLIIQALDGNLLVPLLFSEVVNLHPLWIIIAVLVFGGLWGIWGVFFAIPLATLVKATWHAWPSLEDDTTKSQD